MHIVIVTSNKCSYLDLFVDLLLLILFGCCLCCLLQDGGSSAMSDTTTINVDVTDTLDPAPVFSESIYLVELNEGSYTAVSEQ